MPIINNSASKSVDAGKIKPFISNFCPGQDQAFFTNSLPLNLLTLRADFKIIQYL